jgi:phage-related protein
VQHGQEPSDWKPLKTVGSGVREIRIQQDGQYRVIYVATLAENIRVLHAFQKKTQKTRKRDLEIARQRLKQIRNK